MGVMLPAGTMLAPGELVLPSGKRLRPVGDRWDVVDPEPQYFEWQYLDEHTPRRLPLSKGAPSRRAASECSGCGAPHEAHATACAYCRKPR